MKQKANTSTVKVICDKKKIIILIMNVKDVLEKISSFSETLQRENKKSM